MDFVDSQYSTEPGSPFAISGPPQRPLTPMDSPQAFQATPAVNAQLPFSGRPVVGFGDQTTNNEGMI